MRRTAQRQLSKRGTRADRSFRMRAFSLEELLIYLSIASMVSWLSLSLVLSTNRSNNSMLQTIQLRERWSKISNLLNDEIAEGMSIGYSTAPSAACGGGNADNDLVVTVTIPYLNISNQVATTSISYFSKDRSLYRCGPGYQDSGRLQVGQPQVLALLSDRVVFQVDRSVASPIQDPGRALSYSIQFLNESNTRLLTRNAVARARVTAVQ